MDKAEGGRFETTALIYMGQVRSRPVGIWVNEVPQKGGKWAVLCGPSVAATKVEDLLKEHGQGCSALLLEEVEADLDLSAKISEEKSDVHQALKLASKSPSKLHCLFFAFMVNAYQDSLLKDFSALDGALTLMEDPTLERSGRVTLMNEIDSLIMMRAEGPILRREANRLIVSYFRVAALDSQDTENILGTFLPNVLGLASGLEKRSAVEVFKDYSTDKTKALRVLRNSPFKKEAQVLLDWINA